MPNAAVAGSSHGIRAREEKPGDGTDCESNGCEGKQQEDERGAEQEDPAAATHRLPATKPCPAA